MSGLRMGVALANQHPRDADQYAGLLDQLRIARRAEELGWDSVWTGQHFLLSGLCMLQPVPYLARIAGETERLRVNLAVSQPGGPMGQIVKRKLKRMQHRPARCRNVGVSSAKPGLGVGGRGGRSGHGQLSPGEGSAR